MTEGEKAVRGEENPHTESIKGPDGEEWGKWIVGTEDEKLRWDNISSPELKMSVRLLARRPEELVTPEILATNHARIEGWIVEGKVSLEESAEWLTKIEIKALELVAQKGNAVTLSEALAGLGQGIERTAVATEETAKRVSGEITEELPDSEEKQREIIIGLVEHVETSDLPVAPTGLSQQLVDRSLMNRIEGLLANESCIESVRKEATARLRLQHCYAIASAIPGRSEIVSEFLMGAFLQPESRRWALEGEDFHLFFREGIKNLNVAGAFILLQEAYTKGYNGKLLGDKNISLSERDRIIKGIEKDLGGGRAAKKSLELAQRIARATLETSVWNREIVGGDPLAEALYFNKYRKSRREQGRDRGPDITIEGIPGFGASFFRGVRILKEGTSDNGGNYLVFSDPDHNPNSLKMKPAKYRISKMLERIRGQETEGGDFKSDFLLNVGEYDYDQIKPGEYSGWLGVSVPRMLKTKSLLLQTAWKPLEDFNSDSIEGYIAPFNTSDPGEAFRLRAEFILGVLHSVYSRPNEAANLGWDSVSLSQVKTNLTAQIKGEEGDVPAFLSKEQLEWVRAELRHAGINIEHQAAMVNVKRSVIRRYVSG